MSGHVFGVGDTILCPGIKRRKKEMTFPVWVQFINLCDNTPVFLRHIAYQELNVIQRMIPRTELNHSRNPTKVSYLVH